MFGFNTNFSKGSNNSSVQLDMDMGGPMISGNWINQKTGDMVTVRDTYMDGDNIYVMLTNGQQLSLSEFQDYVQMSDDEYNSAGIKTGTAPTVPKPKQDASVIFDGMDKSADIEHHTTEVNDITNELNKILSADVEEPSIPSKVMSSSQPSSGKSMIEKIFDKQTETPSLDVNVSWDNFPIKELLMLKEYFDITDEDIASVIIEKFVNIDCIHDMMIEWLKDQLKEK